MRAAISESFCGVWNFKLPSYSLFKLLLLLEVFLLILTPVWYSQPSGSAASSSAPTNIMQQLQSAWNVPQDLAAYSSVMNKTVFFLQGQKCGRLVNNRVPWRGDACLTDGWDLPVCASGTACPLSGEAERRGARSVA